MPEANRQLNITVPLTSALVEKNVALRPEDAIPALAGELHWAVERVSDARSNDWIKHMLLRAR